MCAEVSRASLGVRTIGPRRPWRVRSGSGAVDGHGGSRATPTCVSPTCSPPMGTCPHPISVAAGAGSKKVGVAGSAQKSMSNPSSLDEGSGLGAGSIGGFGDAAATFLDHLDIFLDGLG